MEQLIARYQQAEQAVKKVKNPTARRDLLKMLKTVDQTLADISKESVECRRIHHATARYETLVTTADQTLDNLEKYLVYAVLLTGWQTHLFNI